MRLSLEELEAEHGDDGEPFELDLGADVGVVSLPNPKNAPFDILLVSNPALVLREVMGDETFDTLSSLQDPVTKRKRITLGILEGILDRYYKHYGLGSPGEGSASHRSVSGSAGQSRRT